MQLGATGIWTFQLELVPAARAQELAHELEDLGFGTVWIPEAVGREAFTHAAVLLAGTEQITVATGVAQIWARDAMAANAGHQLLNEAYGGRFVLGLGVSHQPFIDGIRGHRYDHPVAAMREYLDRMDGALYLSVRPPEPPARMLAALGPNMLRLARDRTAGALTYLVTPEHTACAREVLGDNATLAVEQAVVLESDPDVARQIGRAHLSTYIGLPNYRANWLRLGFDESDLDDGGSDRLVDALVAWGDEDAVVQRVDAHRDAGADHVCVQAIVANPTEVPEAQWRRLAAALL